MMGRAHPERPERFDAVVDALADHELSISGGLGTGGRVVSMLKGGYNLKGLASSAAAHVAALMR